MLQDLHNDLDQFHLGSPLVGLGPWVIWVQGDHPSDWFLPNKAANYSVSRALTQESKNATEIHLLEFRSRHQRLPVL